MEAAPQLGQSPTENARLEKRILLHRFNRWHGWIREATEQDKAAAETLNALNTVGSFIAGIQSQIIGMTMTLPMSPLARAANTLAFVGLILDVVGTFLGVLHALLLQRRLREHTRIMTLLNSRRDDIIRYLDSNHGTDPGGGLEASEARLEKDIMIDDSATMLNPHTKRPKMTPVVTVGTPHVFFTRPDGILARLKDDIKLCGHSVGTARVQNILSQADEVSKAYCEPGDRPQSRRRSTIAELLVTEVRLGDTETNPPLVPPSPFDTFTPSRDSRHQNDEEIPGNKSMSTHSRFNSALTRSWRTFVEQVASILVVGAAPLLSMGIGVGCLITSTILFAAAASELPSEIWISCVAVLAAVVVLSNISLLRLVFQSD